VVPVANALAEGWSQDFLGARQMAAPAAAKRGLTPRSVLASTGHFQMFDVAPLPIAGVMSDAPARPAAVSGQARLFHGAAGDLLQPRVLLDTADQPKTLPVPLTLTGVTWAGDAAAQQALAQAGDLSLAIYVGDMAAPRASVRLRDLAAAGRRPLNLRCHLGERVRVVVEGSPSAPGAGRGGQMELRLVW
jgi:hypothetical protein